MTGCNNEKIKVCICLGSSCFSQGSKESVKALQEFIAVNNFGDRIDIIGSLCEGNCKEGPIVKINSDRHTGVTPGTLIDLVKYYLEKSTFNIEKSIKKEGG